MNKILYLWKSGFQGNLHPLYQGQQNHCNCRQPGPTGPSRLRRRQQLAEVKQATKEGPANEQESIAEEDNAAEDVAAVIEII